MKSKVFIQILVLSIIGSAMVQAQENINRLVKKEVKEAKRDIRKTKRDIKKSMKDVEWDEVYFDESKLEDIFEGPVWIHEDKIDHYVDALDHFTDLMEDFEVDMDELEVLDELEILENMDLDIPLMHFNTPDINVMMPEIFELKEIYSESGNTLSLSKDLEDVSVSKDFFFSIKEAHKSLDMIVEGNLNSGELTITVKKPDGEVFQEFQISPLADIAWSQKIDLDEDGEVAYTGKWTINLTGTKATGNYNIRFKTK